MVKNSLHILRSKQKYSTTYIQPPAMCGVLTTGYLYLVAKSNNNLVSVTLTVSTTGFLFAPHLYLTADYIILLCSHFSKIEVWVNYCITPLSKRKIKNVCFVSKTMMIFSRLERNPCMETLQSINFVWWETLLSRTIRHWNSFWNLCIGIRFESPTKKRRRWRDKWLHSGRCSKGS